MVRSCRVFERSTHTRNIRNIRKSRWVVWGDSEWPLTSFLNPTEVQRSHVREYFSSSGLFSRGPNISCGPANTSGVKIVWATTIKKLSADSSDRYVRRQKCECQKQTEKILPPFFLFYFFNFFYLLQLWVWIFPVSFRIFPAWLVKSSWMCSLPVGPECDSASERLHCEDQHRSPHTPTPSHTQPVCRSAHSQPAEEEPDQEKT